MRISLIIVVVVGAASAAKIGPIRDCDGFSAAKCVPDEGTDLGTNILATEDACQDGCEEDAVCRDYTFDPSAPDGEKCTYYKDTYRQHCSLYAGNREAKLDTCIRAVSFNNDCDKFLLQDCEYNFAKPIEEAARGSIVDAYHCQEYCEIFGDAGCTFWVFESSETAPLGMTKCSLYNYNFNRSECPIHHGPGDAPHYNEACQNP